MKRQIEIYVRGLIESGVFSLHMKIPMFRLADQFSVSSATVRKAMLGLGNMVTVEPGLGVFVGEKPEGYIREKEDSLKKQIGEKLRILIESGAFPPNMRIYPEVVAAEFWVSNYTAWAAIHGLGNLVQTVKQYGVFVGTMPEGYTRIGERAESYKVITYIFSGIASGKIKKNDRVYISDFRKLGVSDGSIRTIIEQLVAEGFVTRKTNGEITVNYTLREDAPK